MQTFSLLVAAAAVCALVLTGCGGPAPSPAPSPTPSPTPSPAPSLSTGWDNHFAAFGEGVAAQDAEDPTQGNEAALDRIMQDYDDNSVVRIWEYGAADQPSLHQGLSAIRQMFDGLFPALKGCNGVAANQLKAAVEVDEVGSQVFLVWKCEATGFYRATDTFVFDGAIIRIQNIVVGKSQAAMAAEKEGDALVQFRRLSYNPTSVADAWANHAEAFMAGAAAGSASPQVPANITAALDQIMLDYTDSSVVRIFNFATDDMAAESPFTEHTGMTEIRAMFDGLFNSFTDPTPPVVPLAAEWPEMSGGIFLIWAAPDSGYLEATDTFVFDGSFKISRQNIAINTAPAAA